MTRPKETVSWHHDLVPLLLANGFELGYTGDTAWRTDNQGVLWVVANVDRKAVWYEYRDSFERPSTRLGEMSRERFQSTFLEEPNRD